ncbi:Fic family protein [Olsenella sp. Marseille-P4559]|uniref:Fic family protein n=1 Tax=Olsenella sp. Marseille-P4559 TaxID=2364795 RepID=UPI0010313C32|nr:Fic family protein [Olsenella sp. Marseille-P4559]
MDTTLLEVLVYQRDHHIDGNVYKACQCDFAYNSNHIEGSTLTHDQTVQIFDRAVFSGTAKVDDIVETRNHFSAFDQMLDSWDAPLDTDYLCGLHRTLKEGTSDAGNPMMAVGSFKRLSNVIGGAASDVETAAPTDVPGLVDALVCAYEDQASHTFDDIVRFHWGFERIHPFSDGNGRVGRLVMFKECLRAGLTPFIITEDLRGYYLRGLREYERTPGYLTDTCGFAQDRFEEGYMPLAREFASEMRAIGMDGSHDDGERKGRRRGGIHR